MSRDTLETLGFIAALVVWAVLAAVVMGGCGGGPRRCADTMATDNRRQADSPCRVEGR